MTSLRFRKPLAVGVGVAVVNDDDVEARRGDAAL